MNHHPNCPEPTASPRVTKRDQATREECPACGQVTYSDDWPNWESEAGYYAQFDQPHDYGRPADQRGIKLQLAIHCPRLEIVNTGREETMDSDMAQLVEFAQQIRDSLPDAATLDVLREWNKRGNN